MLLPQKDESFWLNCKKNNVYISITKYPISIDCEAIEKTAQKYGVKISYQDNTNLITKTTNYTPFDLTGKQNIKEEFRICFESNKCISLRNGRLYPCSRPAYVSNFNDYFNENLEVSEADSIDIYKAENMDEIFDFLRRPVPFCRYCDWKRCETQIPWHTSSRQISEWT
jgi:hypothetical protein